MIEVGRLLKNCRTRLEGLVSFRSIEIRERGGRTTPQALAIADPSDERIKLAVERFGRTAPERTEMLPLNFKRSARVICREDFCKQLRRVLAENFPDETVEKVSVAFRSRAPALRNVCARSFSPSAGPRRSVAVRLFCEFPTPLRPYSIWAPRL
jgi:signal recognition particle subunit SEC65